MELAIQGKGIPIGSTGMSGALFLHIQIRYPPAFSAMELNDLRGVVHDLEIQMAAEERHAETERRNLEAKNAKLNVMEKLMTHDQQTAVSDMTVELNGAGSTARIVSRSVAKGTSVQTFHPIAVGNALCHAHVQCDSIIMDQAQISSIPEINARNIDAQIIHEAAIGRINNDQILKLRTFGLTEEEAEAVIIEDFLA